MGDQLQFFKSMTDLTTGVLSLSQASSSRDSQASDRLGKLLPTRVLGRTGEAVTMLGVGGWHIGRMSSERSAQATIEAALEGGVRFFDSAASYQDGGSESRLGRLLTPKYRDVVFVMTKTTAHDADTARRHLEDSLRRLATNYLDLWQVHGVGSPEDVDGRIQRGVFDVMLEAKTSGKARYIGFTGHSSPSAHQRVLEKTDIFDTCQMPINLADPSYASFIKGVLPTLVERKIGVLAMKTLANGGFFGGSTQGEHGDNPKLVPYRVSIAEAIRFVWSLPVSVLISGADKPEHMKEKIAFARSFARLKEQQCEALVENVATLVRTGQRVEFYKA